MDYAADKYIPTPCLPYASPYEHTCCPFCPDGRALPASGCAQCDYACCANCLTLKACLPITVALPGGATARYALNTTITLPLREALCAADPSGIAQVQIPVENAILLVKPEDT